MGKALLSTNVYTFSGTVLISGSCLETVWPEAFAELSRNADEVYTLCLEESHINMAVTKILAMLATGKVMKLMFASVDRSPHCTQMHYIKHELERSMPVHVPIVNYVVSDGKIVELRDETIERSKTLAWLNEAQFEA